MEFIYKLIVEYSAAVNSSKSYKKVDTFLSEKEAKESLYKLFKEDKQAIIDKLPTDPDIEENIDSVSCSIVSEIEGYLSKSENYLSISGDYTYIGYTDGLHQGIYYIRKVPIVFALVSLDSEIFDYPTDLIGIYANKYEAMNSAAEAVQIAMIDYNMTDEQFNDEIRLQIFRLEVGEDVHYHNADPLTIFAKGGLHKRIIDSHKEEFVSRQ